MSQKKVLLAASSIFLFLLFVLEYTVNNQIDSSVSSGEVGGVQTALSPTPAAPSLAPSEGSPTIASPSARRTVKVTRIVDGDTIKIDSGETLRYIGIDTPESVDPRQPVQCFAKEASQKNKELVLEKTVELERDLSKTDRYGRLLAYVWIGKSLINEQLVREGYAFSRAYPPDVRYQARLHTAERLARTERKGLWGESCSSVYSFPTLPLQQ